MLLMTSLASGQEVKWYPKGQECYHGGEKQFYKDFQKVLLEQNLKPCENKEEIFSAVVQVNPDGTMLFEVKEEGTEVESNRCTVELTKAVFKHLKGWIPAEIDGEKITAKTRFYIVPNDMFANYKEGYVPNLKKVEPKGGYIKFGKAINRNIDTRAYSGLGLVKMRLSFVVERDGSVNRVEVQKSSFSESFDKEVINAVMEASKNGWIPATVSGIPIRVRAHLPLTFNFE